MDTEYIICADCKKELNSLEGTCPFCNSEKKELILKFEDNVKIREFISWKSRNFTFPCKKRIREEYEEGYEQSVNGEWVNKIRIINRDKNYYFEHITNSKGEVIRFCEQPLKDHTDRGSAKFKRMGLIKNNITMIVYLDLNIFDRLEKLATLNSPERDNYQQLLDLIENGTIIVPYSNAHLNDLFRGFQKNPDFIEGHLNYIESITKNLCICQYWGKPTADWHYRSISEFFNSKCTEWEYEPDCYANLFKDYPDLKAATELYKYIPLDSNFKKGYQDPMFGVMFPSSKIHNTYYALHEDIFNFQVRLKSDFSLYKSFKNYLFTSLHKMKNNKEFIRSMNTNFKDLPKHLEITDILDAYSPNNKTSENAKYSRIIDVFFKYDLSGYKTDGHFNNMFDDGLHSFYAAHCDVFITNDERCKYKAEKTFEKLKITTKVIKSDQINDFLN